MQYNCRYGFCVLGSRKKFSLRISSLRQPEHAAVFRQIRLHGRQVILPGSLRAATWAGRSGGSVSQRSSILPPCMPVPTKRPTGALPPLPSPNTIIMPPAWYSPRKLPASPPMMSTGCFSRYAFIWMPAR